MKRFRAVTAANALARRSRGGALPLIVTLPDTFTPDTFTVKYDKSGVPQWANAITEPGSGSGRGIVIDATGIYVSGGYYSDIDVDLGNGVILPASPSLFTDVFIVKYSTSGIAQWAKAIQGNGSGNDIGTSIAIDATGLYVSGFYISTSAVDLGNGVTLPISLAVDGFIAKYNTSGTAQWAKVIQGTGTDNGNSIATDSTGFYVAGSYISTSAVDLGNGVILPISVGQDAFIIKYNTSGTAQWAKVIQGTGTDSGNSIATDSTGFYVAGSYISTSAVDLGNSITLPISVSTTSDAFIVKYNTSGTAQWAKVIQGTGNDTGYSIATDSTGFYISGSYISTSAVDLGNGVTLPISVGQDAFIIKYNTSGTAQWAKVIQGTGTDEGFVVAVDDSGIYVSGSYISTSAVDLGNGVTLPISVSTTPDTFIIKYNTSGTAQWAKVIQGTSTDRGRAIALDSTGVYLTGTYRSGLIVTL